MYSNMIKLLSIAKIFLLFSVLTSFLAQARDTKLPILSIVGHACDQNERVSVHVRLEASKSSPAYCFSQAIGPDGPLRYPHAFYLYGVTVTDYSADLSLDIDTQERMREKVLNSYPHGVNFDGSLITGVNYFKNCEFRIKEVSIYTQQTNLVIRDSFYNRLENTFKIPQGSTRTADYSFNRSNVRVKLKVLVIKDE